MPSRNGLNLGMLSAAAAAAKDHHHHHHHHDVGGSLLGPGFPFVTPTIPGTNVPIFPPMMDMSSTQALLSMVRSTQFDAFMSAKTGGGGTKRPSSSSSSSSNPPHHGGGGASAAAASEQNPLDLSSSAPCKKPRKGMAPGGGGGGVVVGHWESAFAETFLNMPAFGLALQKSREKAAAVTNGGGGKRPGSLSPKPTRASKQSTCQAAANRALPCASSCAAAPAAVDRQACPNAADKSIVAAWTVDDVCDFVGTIDLCAEYSRVSIFTSLRV